MGSKPKPTFVREWITSNLEDWSSLAWQLDPKDKTALFVITDPGGSVSFHIIPEGKKPPIAELEALEKLHSELGTFIKGAKNLFEIK